MEATVSIIEMRLEDLDLPARNHSPADSADQFFALAAKHDAGNNLDLSGFRT
jgi:hypothetical protein